GTSWTQVGATTTINMSASAYIGLAVSALNGNSTALPAVFDSVGVGSGQDFLLTVAPKAVISGASIQYSVNVDALVGFSGTVALSVSGLPSGATYSFSPSSLTSGISILTVTPSSSTAANSYPLVITGTSGALSHA